MRPGVPGGRDPALCDPSPSSCFYRRTQYHCQLLPQITADHVDKEVKPIKDEEAAAYIALVRRLTDDLMELELANRDEVSRKNKLRRQKENDLLKMTATSYDLRVGEPVSHDGKEWVIVDRVEVPGGVTTATVKDADGKQKQVRFAELLLYSFY